MILVDGSARGAKSEIVHPMNIQPPDMPDFNHARKALNDLTKLNPVLILHLLYYSKSHSQALNWLCPN